MTIDFSKTHLINKIQLNLESKKFDEFEDKPALTINKTYERRKILKNSLALNFLNDAVHNELNYLSKEDIADSIALVLDYLKKSLKEQERIEIRGFGSFSVRQRKFPKNDKFYKTIYYRMPKNLFKD